MKILWQLNQGFIREIVDEYGEPKPAYTTVATMLKILEKKGFVKRKAFGNSHQYIPVISREDYTKKFLNGFVQNYFADSYKNLVSFLGQDKKLTLKELEEVIELLQQQADTQKLQDNE